MEAEEYYNNHETPKVGCVVMLFLIILIILSLCFSCDKIPIEPNDEINISLDYTFPIRSGDITPKGMSGYMDFFTKYVEGRILTPKIYNLTLEKTEKYNEHYYVKTCVGKWGDKTIISVPTGMYHVYGWSSDPLYSSSGDTCYFNFDDTIVVTTATTTLNIKALYACSLILLDTTNVKSTSVEGIVSGNDYKATMMKTEEYYHVFVNSYYNLRIIITQRNYRQAIIPLANYSWMFGKYYYFNNNGNNYNLTPMTNK